MTKLLKEKHACIDKRLKLIAYQTDQCNRVIWNCRVSALMCTVAVGFHGVS